VHKQAEEEEDEERREVAAAAGAAASAATLPPLVAAPEDAVQQLKQKWLRYASETETRAADPDEASSGTHLDAFEAFGGHYHSLQLRWQELRGPAQKPHVESELRPLVEPVDLKFRFAPPQPPPVRPTAALADHHLCSPRSARCLAAEQQQQLAEPLLLHSGPLWQRGGGGPTSTKAKSPTTYHRASPRPPAVAPLLPAIGGL